MIRYAQPSDLYQLLVRIVQLRQSGHFLKHTAQQLNREGIMSLRGCRFTNSMVSQLLVRLGLHLSYGRKRPKSVVLAEHEWWLPDLADELNMPRTRLAHWYNIGWIRSRKLPGLRGRLILWADEAEVNRLMQLRQTRRGWSDSSYPKELTTPKFPDSCSANRKGAYCE